MSKYYSLDKLDKLKNSHDHIIYTFRYYGVYMWSKRKVKHKEIKENET